MSQISTFNPLIKMILPLSAGIIISKKWILSDSQLLLLLSICFIICIISITITINCNFRYESHSGLIIILNLLSVSVCLQTVDNRPFFFFNSSNISENTYLTLEVIDDAVEKDNYYRLKCKIIDQSHNYPYVFVYLDKHNVDYVPLIGHSFAVNKHIAKIKPPKNHNDFNFQQYCFYNNIGYSVFLNKNNISIVDSLPTRNVKYQISVLRSTLLDKLKKNSPDHKSYSVAAALILGEDEISDETRQSFSAAGIIHVLCVSGLHVATIFLLITTILNTIKFNKIKKLWKYLSLIISLMFIWLYAALTGMSPSVTRATLMITMVTIGKIANINTDIKNNLTGSAIILILLNPDTIFSIGTQMSYAAVTGILLFENKFAEIYKKYFDKQKNILSQIAKRILDIISVSISVQIVMTPIVLYYFHNFSTYFMFANIFAIPLATMILYVGIIFLIISPLPYIQVIIGKLLNCFVNLLIKSAELIESIPFSVRKEIYCNGIMTIIILLIALTIRKMLFAGTSEKRIILTLILFIMMLSEILVQSIKPA